MVDYILEYNDGTQDVQYKVRLVQSISYSAPQAIIKKESVGGNGGLVVNTGRLTKSLTMTGKIVNIKQIDLNGQATILKTFNDIKNEIENIKEGGYIVTLRTPLSTNDAGKYVIENFECELLEGIITYIPFTLALTEYRQANVSASVVNLIAVGPREQFLDRLRVSLQGS